MSATLLSAVDALTAALDVTDLTADQPARMREGDDGR